MKLLLLTEFFPESEKKITGGVETRAWHLCKNASKEEIIVICSRQPGQKKEETIKVGMKRVKVYRVGPEIAYSNDGHFFERLSVQIAAYNKSKAIKEEWTQVHGMSFLMYPIAGLLRSKKKKSSITYHECWIGEWRKYKKFPISLFGELNERFSNVFKQDKIISVSKFTQEKLKKKTGKKSIVIPNGIELEEYKKYSGRKNGAVIIGRLTKDKNVGFALENLKELGIKTTVIGEGPLRKELMKKYKEVEFTGRLERKDLLERLSKAEVYVNASTLEGFGIGVIEAAASGTKFVVSDIPPFREVTEGGRGGALFKALDSKDFKRKFEEVKYEPEVLRKLAEKYEWKKLSNKFFEVLE